MSIIAKYSKQTKELRSIAIKHSSIEKVAEMTDSEVNEFIENNYKIFWGDDIARNFHESNDEEIILIPNDIYDKLSHEIIKITR